MDCCEEYERVSAWSRRRFLGTMAATGTAAVATNLFGEAVRQASFGAATGGNVLVVLSFRGGIDGLGMVVPHGDPAYYTARPHIGVPAAQLLAADATFGLHPDLAPLKWAWDAGELAAVHAVGLPVPNRSHFEATEEIEDADPTSSVRRGWVNRMVGLNASPSPIDALTLGTAVPPTLVTGPSPSVSADDLASVRLAGADGDFSTRRKQSLNTMWGSAPGPLGSAARSAFQTVRTLAPVTISSYQPAAAYPTGWPATDLSNALKDTARLIKADLGTQVVAVDFGGWDMHEGYGTLDWGRMTTQVSAFARVLSAFLQDLGSLRSRVTVATISEFGRRVAENGNRGLDHGWGNMMLLCGGGVRGGRYYGSWPGLGSGSLVEGDLKVTTDYRQVLGEVVNRRFPDKAVSQVFPGLPYAPLGVMA